MPDAMTIDARSRIGRYDLFAAGLIAVLVAIRLAAAAAAPLAFDETYYWLWSKHLAGGYLDHPPMVAVVIRLGTMLAGDTALGIRIVSVLLAIPATWAVWRSAAILIPDRRAGPTAALYFNSTLIVAVGTIIVTPDAPLIVAAAFVLLFLVKVSQTGQGAWWLAVGVAVGLALLSKYTTLFFGVSILIFLLLVPAQRRWLLTPWPYLGGIVAFALFAPVVIWNAGHDWASFAKQFGRAVVDDWTLRYLGEHLAAQFGLATPSIAVLGLMGLWAFARGEGAERPARVLVGALFWPLTLYFLWHSLHARVEGNWTAPLFPAFVTAAAAAAYTVHWTGGWATLARWSVRLAVPVGLALTAVIYLQALFGLVPLGRVDPSARQLGAGWPALAAEIDAIRLREGAPVVMTETYAVTGWLSFYLPSRPPVVQFHEGIRWVQEPPPDPALFRGPVLYVCLAECDFPNGVRARYAVFEELARLTRTRRGVPIETYAVYRLAGPKGAPIDR
jgi:4-amino-4-deoxy-L-arabinose transferase-like glycosyltransferase